LCALFASNEPSNDEFCTYLAAESAADEASCKMAAADCVEAGKDDEGALCVETAEGSSCIGPAEDADQCNLDGCGATVSEIEACVRELVDAYAMETSSVSCADAGKEVSGTSEAPESCEVPFKTCPFLFQ